MSRRNKLRFVTILTFVRFPLVMLFFVGALVYAQCRLDWVFGLSLTCLVLSALTDLFDGYYARKLGVVTAFGAHADPLMDKCFYLSTLPLPVFLATKNGHVNHGIFLLVLTILFLARDQWVTFLRSIGSMYNVSGSAHWSGKVRTCLNFPLICCIYYFEEAPHPLFPAWFIYTFEVLGLIVNMVSLYMYTHRYWPYLRKSTRHKHGE